MANIIAFLIIEIIQNGTDLEYNVNLQIEEKANEITM